jgi:general secretion pathway protein G
MRTSVFLSAGEPSGAAADTVPASSGRTGMPAAAVRSWRQRMVRGFTLIELLVVMAIIAVLLTLAAPRYFEHLSRSREAALKQTLMVTRDAIDKFRGDRGSYPDSLDELVERQYLRKKPFDPVTDSADTWIIVPPRDSATESGVADLKSGADGESHDGVAFADF